MNLITLNPIPLADPKVTQVINQIVIVLIVISIIAIALGWYLRKESNKTPSINQKRKESP